MKKVILFGDSICLGYQKYVKNRLEGVVEVIYPEVNCAFAQNVLRYANIWKDEFSLPEDTDLVHWNAGLWDVLRIMGDDVFTPPIFYGQLLERLQKRFSLLYPKAKQVFALSTSVIEEGYEPPYQRYNADIEQFNQIAVEKLTPLGVSINDLYSVTKLAPKSCRSDVTHFNTEEGVLLVGEQVVKSICEQLNINNSDLKDSEAVLHNYSKKVIGW